VRAQDEASLRCLHCAASAADRSRGRMARLVRRRARRIRTTALPRDQGVGTDVGSAEIFAPGPRLNVDITG